jgi:hypothetical protein
MHGGWRRAMWRDSRGAMSSPTHERDRRPRCPLRRNDRLADAVRRWASCSLSASAGTPYYDLTSATIWP